MADDLSRIERNYGCYAEYQRSMQEQEELEYEKENALYEYYENNQKLIDEAIKNNNMIAFSDHCIDCKCQYYTNIGMTHSEDDVPHGICNNKYCDIYKSLTKTYSDEELVHNINMMLQLLYDRGKNITLSIKNNEVQIFQLEDSDINKNELPFDI